MNWLKLLIFIISYLLHNISLFIRLHLSLLRQKIFSKDTYMSIQFAMFQLITLAQS